MAKTCYYWVSYTKSKESHQGQSIGGGWEIETHGGGEKEKKVGVSEEVLGQSFG